MLEDNFRDICQDENLSIRERKNPDSKPTWVMEDDRQRSLLDRFWGKLEPRKSLIFYYCNQGNGVDDTINRLIVGVGGLNKFAPRLDVEEFCTQISASKAGGSHGIRYVDAVSPSPRHLESNADVDQ